MAECSFGDVRCGIGNAVSDLTDDAIGNLAKAIMEGMSQMVTTLSTFWVSMPAVNLASADGSTASPIVSAVNSELMPWTLALAVLAVILGGIRLIWEQRGAPLKDLLRSLITLTLVTGLGLGVISILVIAADAFSAEIIERSTNGQGFAESLKILVMTNQTGVGVFILIVLGLIGLIASLVQVVLMVVRSGMLVILAGILPTTAAFTNTEMGRQWFQKAVGWTIAFILYKPAAAIVYSVAFLLMGNSGGQNALIGSITGFTLMVVALFALPALMRFVTPMVGAVASGGGAGAGAAVGAIATGAVSLGRGGSGRGNASPTPASSTSTQSTQPGGSPRGSEGPAGPRGGGGQPTPSTTGPDGAAGTAAAAKAGTAGAGTTAGTAGAATGAGGGAAAAGGGAAAAGPAGVAVATGAKLASGTSQAIEKTAQDSTGEGPSGSN
ncbi:type IV secretion system protein [Paenarthrobacter aromaticivorans]|uniref:Type IV secretion system protein n=1 Tax=Paenarthrobacter aromaticivorans TaxID=2849150 RepID=A0ABS6I842_9MICC|nr:type IV secretion system protein [Paenarthrobacter sp. MMS21-TAE1-1]MBU8867882.1 type IV secretion system protein [Paenarthrobacter sp. MMS21-TAE1-1]